MKGQLRFNKVWYTPFSAAQLPWRVVVDNKIIACFAHEKDARGFTAARYKEIGHVESRTKARPRKVKNMKLDKGQEQIEKLISKFASLDDPELFEELLHEMIDRAKIALDAYHEDRENETKA
jgi:hypothetical protein